MQRIKYTAREKHRALKMWLKDGKPTVIVCHIMQCSERSLWRWKSLFNGATESLQSRSSRPKTPDKKAHTATERQQIEAVYADNPTIGYTELYGELRAKHAYSRHYMSLFKYVKKNGLRPSEAVLQASTLYTPKLYNTPEMLGTKWQLDVKFVPCECVLSVHRFGAQQKYYQYTMIDEASLERFLFPYIEHSAVSTVDFIKRAIAFYGYLPKIIQTDNGAEFTDPKRKGEGDKIHAVDELLNELKIEHKLIRPRTPRHNGKVERSHRNDQERLYNSLRFETFEELKSKMAEYLARSNNIPSCALRDRYGKRVWQSPNDKRTELMEILREDTEAYEVRFVAQPDADI